jgi:hypothetical protein
MKKSALIIGAFTAAETGYTGKLETQGYTLTYRKSSFKKDKK